MTGRGSSSALTFASLSGQKVITTCLAIRRREANFESAIEHIAVARYRLLCRAGKADIIAKFAPGSRRFSDDFVLDRRAVVVASRSTIYATQQCRICCGRMFQCSRHAALQHCAVDAVQSRQKIVRDPRANLAMMSAVAGATSSSLYAAPPQCFNGASKFASRRRIAKQVGDDFLPAQRRKRQA